MNERIRELADLCRTEYRGGSGGYIQQIDEEKFAALIVKDIMTTVAAHTLGGESALDVFVNLKRIYE